MKSSRLFLIAALSPALALAAVAQTPAAPPPPPPPGAGAPPPLPTTPMPAPIQPGSPASHSSSVNAVVYGPQGELQALTLRDGVAVTLSPELSVRLQSAVTKGARVQVSGMERVIAGQTSLVVQSLTANGQTFVATPLAPEQGPGIAGGTPPPPPVGAGAPPPPPQPDGATPLPEPPVGATPPPPPQM